MKLKVRLAKRSGLLALGACALAALIGFAFWPGEKEPEYQGEKLSEWLEITIAAPRESCKAVDAIGTDAVPFLLKWGDFEYPRWKRRVEEFYARHPDWPGRRIMVARRPLPEAMHRRLLARIGFSILHEKASRAVPALSRAAHGSSFPRATWAIECLALLGTNALPPMLDILANTNEPFGKRFAVLNAMRDMTYLGSNALPLMPVLVRCACGTNEVVKGLAFRVLSAFAGTERDPVGIKVLSTVPDLSLRRATVRVAADFSTNDIALEILVGAENDGDPEVQAEAMKGLARRRALQATNEFH